MKKIVLLALLLLPTALRGQWVESVPTAVYPCGFAIQDTRIFAGNNSYSIDTGLYPFHGIFKSDDSGRSFHPSLTEWPTNEGLKNTTVTAIAAYDSILLAGSYETGIFRSTDSGVSWRHVDSMISCDQVNSFASHDGFYFAGVAISGFAAILRSSDFGKTWKSLPFLSIAAEIDAMTVKDNFLFIASNRDYMYRTSDDGKHWQEINLSHVTALTTYDSVLYGASYSPYGVSSSIDNGLHWTTSNKGLPPEDSAGNISSIVRTGSGLFASMSAPGLGIFQSHDGGYFWTDVAGNINNGNPDCGPMILFADHLIAAAHGTFWRPLSDFASVKTKATIAPELHSFPNPLTTSTTITLTSLGGYADVSVVNLLGVEVARLFSGTLETGEHSFVWSKPPALPDGLYECLVRMNGEVEHLAMIVIRD